VETLWTIVLHIFQRVGGVLLSPGSDFSLTSLGCALLVAAGYVVIRRRRRGRRIRLRVLARALFPRRFARHPSVLIDLGYVFFSLFVFGAIFGWALLSYQVLSNGVIRLLVGTLGPVAPTGLPELASRALVTLALFLAYELGYWFHHYLCHRVPFLWEFHKVHHTANVLTPLTVFRVHPFDTWLFVNVLAVAVGVTNGIVNYALGITAYQYALSNANLILVVFIHIYIHLQHSHLWIAFRGAAGRILLSPAHHQIHHSNNPVHFNKNLGSCLAVWDWLFGTLYVPGKEPEHLTFGVATDGRDEHTITEAYIAPVVRAARHVAALGGRVQEAPTLPGGAAAASRTDA
jgi:sterol desaturase/sphingolipid hydroxylase (fatty acid hydroxylase superfamily)